MIHVSHLTRRFGELAALDDVTFEVARGEIVGILGVNGAGKTTVMRILTGFLPATSGAASVGGFDVLRESLAVRQRIGYLPENVPLYREHRVVEMLAFQARLHRLSRAEAKRRIPEVLERVGLLDRRRDLIGHLSRGLRQRVGLAVALLPDPEVLILDEPTSGLDPLQRREVRTLVRELGQKHTVLISSHILPEIEAVCPRVIILHKGRVAADGQREELVRSRSNDSHVRVEAVVGADVAAAARMLSALPDVVAVDVGEKLGIHQVFRVRGAGDVREDVGALAAARGWALRELSWRQPTLEELFARIALGIDEESAVLSPAADEAARSSSASIADPSAAPAMGLVQIETVQRVGSAPSTPSVASTPPTAKSTLSSSASTPPSAANADTAPARNPRSTAPKAEPAGPARPTGGSPPPNSSSAGAHTPPSAPKRAMYNLNPFERGAARDLSAPMAPQPAPPPPATNDAARPEAKPNDLRGKASGNAGSASESEPERGKDDA